MGNESKKPFSFEDFKKDVIRDYELCYTSRQVSFLGRREVLAGRAKFSILGGGKELPQVVLSKFFQKGDFRSGYYRDQTWALASGFASVEDLFAQLYGDIDYDRFSRGRQMNNHFLTPFVDSEGNWLNLVDSYNSTADIAPTASQCPRAIGIALASKLFRENPDLRKLKHLSQDGNEVCFCSIGDASTSEGHFFEAINVAGVLQMPIIFLVWDDGYGISVERNKQTTKGSISEVLAGFQKLENTNGLEIRRVNGWDYQEMYGTFKELIQLARTEHVPALVHVAELTQPFGHSSSGSHERYKSKERLEWESEWDGIKKMREWIVDNDFISDDGLKARELLIEQEVLQAKERAWQKYNNPLKEAFSQCIQLTQLLAKENPNQASNLHQALQSLSSKQFPDMSIMIQHIHRLRLLNLIPSPSLDTLYSIHTRFLERGEKAYNTQLYNEDNLYALKNIMASPVVLSQESLNGSEILNRYFDALFKHNSLVVAFGEDVGRIGDVNKGFDGLQEKFSANRIWDTGIRELSIIGKGIGLALRGLRPIAEIQYLDYLLYGLQPLSDDAANTYYRTAGQQVCPLIVRTRGHRLVGMFHSGSPMQVILGALRGMYVGVPRNMVQAIGMYNAALRMNTPVLIIECLNGYRKKEFLPKNLLEFVLPFGQVEILEYGTDINLVSYGATLHLVLEAVKILNQYHNISCEVIDVQSLLPFDTDYEIVRSLKKTNKIIFIDEDVSSGATAFMMQQVIEVQGGFRYLDAAPKTLSARDHRPAYGSDGDYFSKPNIESIIEAIISLNDE